MAYSEQKVTSIRHWSDKTFSLTTTRPNDFNFENGEFVTIGLRPEGKLVARAYSIVSTNDKDYLEFLSIRIPDGPLTKHLSQIQKGHDIWINNKPTGTLTLKHVRPGRNLYLISTGTGLAPFLSLIRDPQTYSIFEHVVLIHTVRKVEELAYKDEIESITKQQNLMYVPTVTREPFIINERGVNIFRSGQLFEMLDLPVADPEIDRVMICGNPDMNKEMTEFLEYHDWTQTNYSGTGSFSSEKAFVTSN
jgi:ferredoxin--NADP+ reductase